jgi:hypothetical protein
LFESIVRDLNGSASTMVPGELGDSLGSYLFDERADQQQLIPQSRNASGREYSYETPAPGGGTQRVSVQPQTLDRSHPVQAHWEAGRVKTDPLTGEARMNSYGRPALSNDKSKVDY